MKKTIKSLLAIAVAAFAFTACSDVPKPEGYNENSGTGVIPTTPAGTGTATDPYNVAGVAAFAQSLAAGETTTQDIYTRGYVSTVKQYRSNYSSIDYYISDIKPSEGKGEEFYVYSGAGLGGAAFASINDLKVGDEVIVCGKITNYNGTIEYQSRNYLVYLNGQTPGGGGGTVDPAGTGTETDPFNVAAAIKKCQETGTTATTEKYYIKGVAAADYTVGSYHNVEVGIVDEGASDVFKVYRCKGNNGKDIPEGYKVNKGDVIIVYGPVVNFSGNTPETATGAYIVSINGVDPAGGGGGGSTIDPAGSGTETDPFNVAAAIKKCEETGTTPTTESFYIKGIANADYTVGSYHNVEVGIVDEGGTDVFKVYRCKGNNGADIAEGYKVKKGDVIIVYGPVFNYSGNTPETATGAYIVSINGVDPATVVPNGGGDSGGGGDVSGNSIIATFADFGFTNAQEMTVITLTDGTTLTFDAGGGTTPKYYNAGTNIRMYAKNTMTINAGGGKKIASIEIACDTYNGTLCNASGDVTCDGTNMTIADASLKASGLNKASVTVANTSTQTGTPSQVRMTKLTITYQ